MMRRNETGTERNGTQRTKNTENEEGVDIPNTINIAISNSKAKVHSAQAPHPPLFRLKNLPLPPSRSLPPRPSRRFPSRRSHSRSSSRSPSSRMRVRSRSSCSAVRSIFTVGGGRLAGQRGWAPSGQVGTDRLLV